MSILATYSPQDIDLLLAGVLRVDGYVDGSFITLSKDFNLFTTVESSDGVPSRTQINSSLYTITLNLASTANTNQQLTYLYRVDEITSMGKFPLMMKDGRGQTLFFAAGCWIEKLPDVEYSTSITSRKWSIKCSDGVLNVGGNYSESSSSTDLFNTGFGMLRNLL